MGERAADGVLRFPASGVAGGDLRCSVAGPDRATTIDQRNVGDGGRPVRTLLTETRLGQLNQSLSHLVLVAPYIDALSVMESRRTTIGDVLPLIERAYETSFERRALFGQLGFLVPDEAIEAVRAAFVRRFYLGGCREIRLLTSDLTFMGHRSGARGSRPQTNGRGRRRRVPYERDDE
jgi:hypothetical protein